MFAPATPFDGCTVKESCVALLPGDPGSSLQLTAKAAIMIPTSTVLNFVQRDLASVLMGFPQ
jgi:hypothetical protein